MGLIQISLLIGLGALVFKKLRKARAHRRACAACNCKHQQQRSAMASCVGRKRFPPWVRWEDQQLQTQPEMQKDMQKEGVVRPQEPQSAYHDVDEKEAWGAQSEGKIGGDAVVV